MPTKVKFLIVSFVCDLDRKTGGIVHIIDFVVFSEFLMPTKVKILIVSFICELDRKSGGIVHFIDFVVF